MKNKRNRKIGILLLQSVSRCLVLVMIIAGGGYAMQRKPLSLDGPWKFKIDSLNRGGAEEWYAAAYNRSSWESVEVPNHWDRYHDLAAYDGAGWYARTVKVYDISQPLSLFFGGVDDDADVWVNGKKVGSHTGYSEPFSMPLDQAVKVGANDIVVRVHDNSGPGGIYLPVKIVPTDELDPLFRTKYALQDAKKSTAWVKSAVLYEVYLRSFSKEGTFGVLEKRIPELKKMGVSVVWLMPIHPTGKKFRKGSLGSPYSVQDYYAVNPEFGTLVDFQSLVNSIHKNGMKIIIDLVANHTAWDNSMLTLHPDWYTHDTSGNIIPPNADWTDVADLNYDNAELRKYMRTMMQYWVRDIGIDGYRCDVAELVPTDFWESVVPELEAIKPVLMLSEGTIPEHHVHAFDLTYSWNVYDVLEKVIHGSTPAAIFHDLLKTESYQFPKGSLRLRFNTNHDKNAWDEPAVEKFTMDGAKTTAVLVWTYPGVPLIFNGEEAGNNKKLSLFEKIEIDWTKNSEFRALYKKISSIRAQHPALVDGSYSAVQNSEMQTVLSFIRMKGEDSVLVIINFGSSRTCTLDLSSQKNSTWKDAFSGRTYALKNGSIHVELPALGYAVLLSRTQKK